MGYFNNKDLTEQSLGALGETLADGRNAAILRELNNRVVALIAILYALADDQYGPDAHDDEILNWTTSDIDGDLNAALWNLGSGYYKASAMCLRSAMDLCVMSLYFTVRELDRDADELGWNKYFSEWDSGLRDTPNWGEMMGILKAVPNVIACSTTVGFNVMDRAHKEFQTLSNYVHGRAWTKGTHEPIAALNLNVHNPSYNAVAFDRFVELAKTSIGWMASVWLASFPNILRADPLRSSDNDWTPYVSLVHSLDALAVLDWARSSSAQGAVDNPNRLV